MKSAKPKQVYSPSRVLEVLTRIEESQYGYAVPAPGDKSRSRNRQYARWISALVQYSEIPPVEAGRAMGLGAVKSHNMLDSWDRLDSFSRERWLASVGETLRGDAP